MPASILGNPGSAFQAAQVHAAQEREYRERVLCAMQARHEADASRYMHNLIPRHFFREEDEDEDASPHHRDLSKRKRAIANRHKNGKAGDCHMTDSPAIRELYERVPAATLLSINEALAHYALSCQIKTPPLRQVYKDLSIPYAARFLEPGEVSNDAVLVAQALPPSVFRQTKPTGAPNTEKWARKLLELIRKNAADSVIIWTAHHWESVSDEIEDYLISIDQIDAKTTPARAEKNSQDWHAAQARQAQLANAERRAELKRRIPYTHQVRQIDIDAFSFHVIDSQFAANEEGIAMHHCVGGRFTLNRGLRIYYSIREGTNRIATAEYHLSKDGCIDELREIKGHCNKRVPTAAERAARRLSSVLTGVSVDLYGPPESAPYAEPRQTLRMEPGDVVLVTDDASRRVELPSMPIRRTAESRLFNWCACACVVGLCSILLYSALGAA